ncbi:MAG: F0F1 ATP synthase subunit gamma [Proteobacteria bacterium]|nr:F0F1 ATP synthase subunit gamma [Pseudomonadota bacterium]
MPRCPSVRPGEGNDVAALKEVRQRIKAVQGIAQVTNAMKMVATVKMKRIHDRLLKARPYVETLYDIAGKWKGNLGRMKASVALGYAINQGINGLHYKEAENFQIQAGLMDPETGLFGSIAYQNEDADLAVLATAAGMDDDTDAWWLKIGIKKQWFSMGDTSLSFDYGQYSDQYGFAEASAGVTGSEVERIGVALDQYFGSSLIIYGKWEQLDLDVDGPAATQLIYGGVDELDTFTLGAVYFF